MAFSFAALVLLFFCLFVHVSGRLRRRWICLRGEEGRLRHHAFIYPRVDDGPGNELWQSTSSPKHCQGSYIRGFRGCFNALMRKHHLRGRCRKLQCSLGSAALPDLCNMSAVSSKQKCCRELVSDVAVTWRLNFTVWRFIFHR